MIFNPEKKRYNAPETVWEAGIPAASILDTSAIGLADETGDNTYENFFNE